MAKKDPYMGDGMLDKAADKLKGRKRQLDDMIDMMSGAPKVDSAVRGHGSENRKKRK